MTTPAKVSETSKEIGYDSPQLSIVKPKGRIMPDKFPIPRVITVRLNDNQIEALQRLNDVYKADTLSELVKNIFSDTYGRYFNELFPADNPPHRPPKED